MNTTSRRKNGRLVIAGLLALCLSGFFATVWNYSRTHPFSSSATLIATGNTPMVKAVFDPPTPAIGQRIVLKISGDSLPARGGTVVEYENPDTVLIAVDTPPDAPVGSAATASVDGTIGPIPLSRKN